jgi:aminoglycoside 3-N-acetyltransferase
MPGELESVRASSAPVTRAGLAADLGRLGVRPGSVLLAHSSLSALGWVCGGAPALLDALGRDGTLVVPTHTSGNCDPATWRNPPVPDGWWLAIREHMPAFDELASPVARVEELDRDVLLLGVGHGSNSSMHLAEHRVPDPPRERSAR